MYHHVFDIALSRSKHRTVGGGLPTMKADAIFLIYRVIVHRGQAPSYQTTHKSLKKLGFVGADLSAKRPVHPTHKRWLKHCIRGQVRSHDVRCLLRDSATSKTWWRLPQKKSLSFNGLWLA